MEHHITLEPRGGAPLAGPQRTREPSRQPPRSAMLGCLEPPALDSSLERRSRSSPRRWLLLRGLGRERRHWFDFPDALAAALRVETCALDLPGMGESHGALSPRSVLDTAREIRRDLSARDASHAWGVLGISLGGMVAIALAAEWPAGISHVVVINASSRCSLAHQRLRPAALAQLAYAAWQRDALARELRIHALTTNAAAHRVSAWAARAAALGHEMRPSRASLLRQLFAAASFRAAPILQPALVLGGAKDRLVAPECSRALADALGATYRHHPTAGHDLPLEEPDWVITQIRCWLESAEANGLSLRSGR